MLLFSWHPSPYQPWGPLCTEVSQGGLPSAGMLACEGELFLKQLGDQVGCSLAQQHLLGHVGCCGGDLPVAAAPQSGFSAVAGRIPAGWLAQGSCVSTPGQGLFPAKSFRGGGKEALCGNPFLLHIRSCSPSKPQSYVRGAAASPQQPLSKRRGFFALAMRQGWIRPPLSAATALSVSCCTESECSSWVK